MLRALQFKLQIKKSPKMIFVEEKKCKERQIAQKVTN